MKLNFASIGALFFGLIGVLIVFGVIQPFASTSSCFGLYLFGNCVGYFSGNSNGNNFVLGILLIGVAAGLYVYSRRRR